LCFLRDSEENWPSRILERAEMERCLAGAIERLPWIEQTVLSLYYYEELMLEEIGRILHIHSSRVSQLKSQAILRLRSLMRRRWHRHPSSLEIRAGPRRFHQRSVRRDSESPLEPS